MISVCKGRAMLATLDGHPLPVFPCYANKRPACANGFKDATTDSARIADLWGGRSGASGRWRAAWRSW